MKRLVILSMLVMGSALAIQAQTNPPAVPRPATVPRPVMVVGTNRVAAPAVVPSVPRTPSVAATNRPSGSNLTPEQQERIRRLNARSRQLEREAQRFEEDRKDRAYQDMPLSRPPRRRSN
jgi:ribosomal protein S2